jgi:threonine aldolase
LPSPSRQAGVLAAAGRAALHENMPKLAGDHARAGALAARLAAVPGLAPQPKVETNMIFVALDEALLATENLSARVAAARAAGADAVVDAESGARLPLAAAPAPGTSTSAAFVAVVRAVANVRLGMYGTTKVRIVTHHQVSDADADALARAAAAAARLLSKA